MLCKVKEQAFDDADWAFEIKWDGYRAIADIRKSPIQLYSRNGIDYSQKFRRIITALEDQVYEMVVDGELVAFDETGKPNFQRLQQIDPSSTLPLKYQVFDLLWLNGHSIQELPYVQRKELLKEALIENDLIQYHDYVLENGISFYNEAQKIGLEGIVAKRVDSNYKEGIRSSEWLKIKIDKTDEAIIVGFTAPKGSRQYFGSLILGKYHDGELEFCGHIGTGFTDKMLQSLYKKMKPLIVQKSALKNIPATNGNPTWIKPKLIASIKFTEITSDNIYRHPVFLELREDKHFKEVSFDNSNNTHTKENKTVLDEETLKIGKATLKLTNQNKIYYPEDEITKAQVIAYYQQMSKYILPHLKGRAQSMHRFPNGIHGLSFYQKDAAEETPSWITTRKLFSESTDKDINYIICNDKATMAYMNNLGCIEFNVWTSKADQIDYPDYLVLDLDPSERNSFEDVIETALVANEVMKELGITAYPKTSGSSGIHIYIPMGARYDFEKVKNFANILMQLIYQSIPGLTTLERSLKKREDDLIYLDYLQNRRGQTLASVYSLRPKKGAPVSMPLEWKELKPGLRPTDFNIHNALERVEKKGDIFKPVLGRGINLLKIIEQFEKKYR